MTDLVRVKDPVSGHEVTVSALTAAAMGVQPLTKDAVGPAGHGLPAKNNVGLPPGDRHGPTNDNKKDGA